MTAEFAAVGNPAQLFIVRTPNEKQTRQVPETFGAEDVLLDSSVA
jgi:hypothetical protein